MQGIVRRTAKNLLQLQLNNYSYTDIKISKKDHILRHKLNETDIKVDKRSCPTGHCYKWTKSKPDAYINKKDSVLIVTIVTAVKF